MINLVGQNHSARDIIQNTFSPLVGVITSPLADEISRRNNLTFVELLQPFAKLSNDVHFRDSSGTSVSTRGIRLNFCDIDWRPPQTILARKMLTEAVTQNFNNEVKKITIGKIDIEVPKNEPWFERWRETFLTVQFPADHEFTRHFISCLIVLSSNDSNIVDTAHKITQRVHQMQNLSPQKLPKWFNPSNVLNSYVILHEGHLCDLSRAQQSYELLKSTFGDNNCFLLQINSLDGSNLSENQDYWKPYTVQRSALDTQIEHLSASRTFQDSVFTMPLQTVQMQPFIDEDNDLPIEHPLSPTQEQANDTMSTQLSISSESLISQSMNPTAWGTEFDANVPLGVCLNTTDIDNLRHFVQDYAVRALIPYVEQLVGTLTETLTNKKGVSKSLLSATKRWFVTSKPGVGVNSQNGVIYSNESPELQTRKLGDLYFMFGHYNMAFQVYHQAKRDFNADSAWQYYAGALEMAAVSAFMLGTANRKTYDYMENAIVYYLTVCKLQQFATRATLLSIECLKASRLYTEAAKQLTRMTSEESDLRSALLLEEAAYCFLATQPSMYRKYAFHIVLAGNRYSRAGQRKHACRCYRQAYQVFKQRSWSLAEDHIQYTMGKHACWLKQLEEAIRSFAHLLRQDSLQTVHQQTCFLKDYLQTANDLIKYQPNAGLFSHVFPQIVRDSVRVLVSTVRPTSNPKYTPATNIDIKSNLQDNHIWDKMEEMIVITAAANKPILFKPTRYLFTKENTALECPVAVQGELIEFAVTVLNPLKCSVTMTEMELLWQLTLENNEVISNRDLYDQRSEEVLTKTSINAAVKTMSTQSTILGECEEQTMYFKITPKLIGRLDVIGIVVKVALSSEANMCLQGMLYFNAEQRQNMEKISSIAIEDYKLSIKIVPAVPSLDVSFTTLSNNLLAGEIVPLMMSLRNTGLAPIKDIFIGTECPRWITLNQENESEPSFTLLRAFKDLSKEKFYKDKEIRRQHVLQLPQLDSQVTLEAQTATTIPMWLQAPFQKGECILRILFYYTLPKGISESINYRLVRHNWCFNVHEHLHSEVAFVVSNVHSNELGVNVVLKNTNTGQEVMKVELYINSLALYCPQFKLNMDKLYPVNHMEFSKGQLGNCLKPLKSASFQCRLENVEPPAKECINTTELLKHNLSCVEIMPTVNSFESQMPALDKTYSFLIKNETLYFKPTMSTEEFNSALSIVNPHATIVLTWTATITQNSVQRVAMGQYFLKLLHLYESGNLPQKIHQIKGKCEMQRELICSLSEKKRLQSYSSVFKPNPNSFWDKNDVLEGVRCMLEE